MPESPVEEFPELLNQLLDRNTVLNTLKRFAPGVPMGLITAMYDLASVVPQVAANITGGILQGYSSSYPVDLYLLDFDDTEEVVEIEGEGSAHIFSVLCHIDSEFTNKVADAYERQMGEED